MPRRRLTKAQRFRGAIHLCPDRVDTPAAIAFAIACKRNAAALCVPTGQRVLGIFAETQHQSRSRVKTAESAHVAAEVAKGQPRCHPPAGTVAPRPAKSTAQVWSCRQPGPEPRCATIVDLLPSRESCPCLARRSEHPLHWAHRSAQRPQLQLAFLSQSRRLSHLPSQLLRWHIAPVLHPVVGLMSGHALRRCRSVGVGCRGPLFIANELIGVGSMRCDQPLCHITVLGIRVVESSSIEIARGQSTSE